MGVGDPGRRKCAVRDGGLALAQTFEDVEGLRLIQSKRLEIDANLKL